MKNDAGNPKINNEGKRINNGCDKRAGHDGRIKAETFGQNRQKAADDFGKDDSDNQGDTDNGSNRNSDTVQNEQLDEICQSQGDAD